MPPLTRGPLPARVYWRRRIMVLALAMVLVVGIARLLGSGSDASEPQARQAAAETGAQTPARDEGQAQAPQATVTVTAGTGEAGHPGKHRKSQAPVLAEPDGTCNPDDILVTPEVKEAVAGPGDGTRIKLMLATQKAEACNWRVSARNLTLKITSGHDEIWSSQNCPRLVPNESVVVRRDVPTSVVLTWNGRRSEDGCPKLTDWALPGFYHVTVAAMGGEPDDTQFELQAPSAPVITRTPHPHQSKGAASNSSEPSGSSSSTD